jgi:hypothetical protein
MQTAGELPLENRLDLGQYDDFICLAFKTREASQL